MSTLYTSGLKCENYTLVVNRLKLSTLFAYGQQVKGINIIHKRITG